MNRLKQCGLPAVEVSEATLGETDLVILVGSEP
jgi:hypothetical protein